MKSKVEQLSVRWQYNAGHGALIWQLMFTVNDDLIGQKRFTANRRALFFCIDTVSGQVVCDDYLLMDHVHPVPAGEGWFVGLETTIGSLVYCYAYQSQSPEHKGIWAVDFRAGRVVWSRPDIVFAANLDHEFLVYQLSAFGGFPERHFLMIDPLTGADIRQLGIDSSTVNTIRQGVVQEEERQKVILSEFVTHDMNIERMALLRAGISETSRSECIVLGSLTVAALHEQSEVSGSWSSVLKVWRRDCLVYEDCMEEDVEKPCLNNFLIRSENLYYLKNKEELVCVALI
ncbi:MAG: DUF4905 domain-containing protein [Chlorobiales bacterium]|nr:DUF4905 domain-containing protein [Chlorobiales bacterium]